MVTYFDFKNAFERVIKDKKYSLAIVASMSLGLAVFLFLFSQVYAKKYAFLPFPDGDSFVYASRYEHDIARLDGGLTDYEILNIAKRQTVLDDVAAFESRRFTLASTSFTEQVSGVATSSNLFKLTGIAPLLGRTFKPSDDDKNSPPVLVISYDIWERLFQKQNDVIGKIIKVDSVPTTVIGVMPQGFKFPRSYDAWLSYIPEDLPGPNPNGWNSIVGKLKKNVSLQQADDALKQISKNISNDYPKEYAGKSIATQLYTRAFVNPISLLVTIMTVVAFCVLLMSLFGVVSLIVVKMIENAKEAAIKNAIGIPFYRIIAGPLLESFVLCTLSGIAGLFLCYLAQIGADKYVTSGGDPFWWKMKMGLPIAISAFLFTLIAWVLTGLLPVYLALRKPSMSQLAGGRKGGGSNKSGPIMNIVISLQVSCAFLLMVFTGICIYSLYEIATANYGVKTNDFITAWIQPSASAYPDLKSRVEYFDKLGQQIAHIPEVDNVTFGGAIPGIDSYSSTYNSLEVDLSNNGNYPEINEIPISENFFNVLGAPLLKGRAFIKADDDSSEQVVIISEKIEKKIFPGTPSLGKKFQLNPDKEGPLLTVVGVAPDFLYGPPISMYDVDIGALYRPMRQVMPSWYGMRIAVKSKSSMHDIEEKLIVAGRAVDSQVALTKMRTYNDFLSQNGNSFRSLSFNFFPATLLAFLMSALGIYAISARTTQQKINDIGVMKALGIRESQINKRFMLDSIVKLGVGLAIGGASFLLFVPNIVSKLVVVDYKVLAINSFLVIMALTIIVLIASYIPLHKAHELTPNDALNK